MVKNNAKKSVHQYFRVIVTYSDGEISGRVFHTREKAEKYVARQKKSPVVKKTTVEAFIRARHDWVVREQKLKDKATAPK